MSKVELAALAAFWCVLGVACDERAKGQVGNHAAPIVIKGSPAATTTTTTTTQAAVVQRDSLKLAPADDARRESDPTLCPRLCEHTTLLRCGASVSDCLTACEQMLGAPICNREIAASYACMVSKGTAEFECGADGVASIKDGVCDAEQQSFVRCYHAAATRR